MVTYPRIGARRASTVLPVRRPLVQLGPQRLRSPGRGKAGLELAQGRPAIRAQFQQVGEPVERVHDAVERVGGTELVEKLRSGIGASAWRCGRRCKYSWNGHLPCQRIPRTIHRQ